MKVFVALLLLAGQCDAFSLTLPAQRSGLARSTLSRPVLPPLSKVASPAVPLRMMADEAEDSTELCDMRDPTPEEECMDDGSPKKNVVLYNIVTATYVSVWFFLNVMYNIANKKCQNVFPMPWTMTLVSTFVGIPLVCSLWLTKLRKTPEIDAAGYKTLAPIGFAHFAGHAGAVIALGAGAVSFTHIIKAGEPVFTALLSWIVLGQVFHPIVYATLIPIIGGCTLAIIKELSFKWVALLGAMTSNIAFASRAVLSKAKMEKPVGKNMDAPNLYAVLNIMSFLYTIPFFMATEMTTMLPVFRSAAAKVGGWWLVKWMIIDGFCYYAYNEVAFVTLSRVSPVTHAVANTMKRVLIITATCLLFGTRMTPAGTRGASIAITGALFYSLAKNWDIKRQKKLEAASA